MKTLSLADALGEYLVYGTGATEVACTWPLRPLSTLNSWPLDPALSACRFIQRKLAWPS